MSAIWGAVSFTGSISSNISSLMEAPYQNTCKIDHYANLVHSNVYFGCGIQYITKESFKEQMPFYDRNQKI